MKYSEAKKIRDGIQAELDAATVILSAFPRGLMNLTPDNVRATDEWKAAKRAAEVAFSKLRRFNATFVKEFKGEIRAERRK